MKRFFLCSLLFLYSLCPAGAEHPYWQWSLQEAEKHETTAREQLKADPDSVEALGRLAGAIIVLGYNDPGSDETTELLKVLKHSYALAPAQTTAILLARYCEDPGESARWAVKALSFPKPSLRALEYFDSLVKHRPELARLENEDVRRARRRLQRWKETLTSYGRVRSDMFKAYSQKDQDRRLSPPDKKFKVDGTILEARSDDGKLLWSKTLGKEAVKLVSFKTALVIIDRDNLHLIEPASGRSLQTLPSLFKTNLKNETELLEWNAWESPRLLLGADKERLYVAIFHWFCVFRRKDATGWARYFSYTIRAVPCPDEKVLIVETHYNQVVAHRLSDGKELWTYDPPPRNQKIDLRKVSDKDVVVYLPGLERLVVLKRDTGEVLEQLSHETLEL